jgi:hypothetical protein
MTEKQLQMIISTYLKKVYPDVIYKVDVAGWFSTTIGIAARNKRIQCSSGFPDMFIAEPRGKYAGLFIELKTDISAVYTKKGQLKKNDKVHNQFEMLQKLNAKGYKAIFTYGYTNTIARINEYLDGKMD